MQPISYGVTWSGGIDSTYVLAKMLKETECKIHALHINFIDMEGRAFAEQEAVKALLPKLQAIRPFKLWQSSINHMGYMRIPCNMSGVCSEIGALQHNLAFHDKAMDYWTIGTHSAEGHNWERWEVIKHAVDASAYPYKAPKFKLQPLVTKQEEMEYLASLGLLDDCWYCRVPRYEGNKAIACNKCFTCKEVMENKNGKDTTGKSTGRTDPVAA